MTSSTTPTEPGFYFAWPFGNPPRQRRAHPPCDNPPLFSPNTTGQSYLKGSDVFYEFMPATDPGCQQPGANCAWTAARKNQVKAAFDAWTAANATSLLQTKFKEATATSGRMIDVVMAFQPNATASGSHQATQIEGQEPRRILLSTLSFNVAPNHIVKEELFFKIGLHEIGHALGLDENYTVDSAGKVVKTGISGSSVMNALSERQDFWGNIPWGVTVCDAGQAKKRPSESGRSHDRSERNNDATVVPQSTRLRAVCVS